MSRESHYDVAVVGASIAGCTAATLFGRRGARVALVERHSNPSAYKTVCTHYIQSSAVPTIERLGILPAIEAEGGLRTRGEFWTRWGWIRPPVPEDHPPYSINLRREKLDPLLRRMAGDTEGVDLMLGQTVDRLVEGDGRVAGVEAVARDGSRRQLDARLVVAADGRDSRVGDLAGVPARVKLHNRFGYWAYYRDVPLVTGQGAQMWFLDPQIAYAFPTDDGLTLLACMLTKDRLEAFKRDVEGSFEGFLRSLPDAPPIEAGTRVSRLVGKLEMPNRSRLAAAHGMAFVGDAAMASDPLWGVGCGWAFQSAEWLVNATSDALLAGGDLERALKRYRKRHRSALAGYEFLNCDYATGRLMNPVERLTFSAAARDEDFAGHFEAYGTRNVPVRRFLGPRALLSAGLINARHRLSARATSSGVAPPTERSTSAP